MCRNQHRLILAHFLIKQIKNKNGVLLNCAIDAAFTYRMLQVIHDEEGQPHIVDADSSLPVNVCSNSMLVCDMDKSF